MDLTLSKEPLKTEPHRDPLLTLAVQRNDGLVTQKVKSVVCWISKCSAPRLQDPHSQLPACTEHLYKCWVWRGWRDGNAQHKTLTYFLIRVRIKPDSPLHNFSSTRVWKQVRACVWGTALMKLFSFCLYSSRLWEKESRFAVLGWFLEKTFPTTC